MIIHKHPFEVGGSVTDSNGAVNTIGYRGL